MPRRKRELVNGELYHIVSKSIAGFKVFNTHVDFRRIIDEMVFYNTEKPSCEFHVLKKAAKQCNYIKIDHFGNRNSKKLVDIIAYCIMPTHIHFILNQLIEKGISRFMSRILQSYSQYFNTKYKRKGPLWEGRFKNILIENDDLFLHITRYIHLNPVTAHLVNKPEDWEYSSYREYVELINKSKKLCNFSNYLDLDVSSYIKFVNDQIAYQRELALVKGLILE